MQSQTDSPAVACILVNWNNWQDTATCLDSLALQDYSALSVVVVDNGSSDDSVARLRSLHPGVAYIESPQNLGFSRACNLGAAHPQARTATFLWFLNNDTIAPPDSATKLVEKAIIIPSAGVIGSVLRYMDRPAEVQAWGGGTINRWTGYNTHFTQPTAFGPGCYLTFASALVARDLFDQLGGLYEGAFMYYEDTDFCLRAQDARRQLAVAETTAILHKEGGSDAVGTQLPSLRMDRIITTAGLLFMDRHCPSPWIGRTLFLCSRIAKRLLTLRFAALRAVLQGYGDYHTREPL